MLPWNWHGDNFLQILTWHGLSFSMFTVWHGFFSFVLTFPGLRIAPPRFTVHGKFIYTFKVENDEEFQLSFSGTNPIKDKHKFLSFKGWLSHCRFIGLTCLMSTISSTDLSALRATIVASSGLIYRPSIHDFWANLLAYCSQSLYYVS